MKAKKLLPLLLAVALIATVGVGATLAYFTDNDNKTNVVTMGHVDIDLTEPAFEEYLEDGISGVVPGQEIDKDPTVTLADDSLDAYIRVKLTVSGFEDIESDIDFAGAILDGLDIQEGWTKIGDYYYYADALTNSDATKKAATLFTKVTIPTSWNNDVADATFTIDVVAEAVQASSLAEDFFNEDGSWNITEAEMLPYEK